MFNPYDFSGRVRIKYFGPSVSGGMSEEATRKLAQEERAWQQQQTELAYARQTQMQADSEERASAAAAREGRIEESEAQALEKMENEVSDNIESMQESEDVDDNDITLDFYKSLATGQGSSKRPE